MRPGSVEVVAPRGVPRKVIDDFIESKSSWIRGKLNLFLSVKGPVPLEEPAEGSVLWLFGEPLELRTAEGDIPPVINPPLLTMGISWFSRRKFCEWLDGMLLERVNSTAEAFSRETGEDSEKDPSGQCPDPLGKLLRQGGGYDKQKTGPRPGSHH